MNVGITGHQKLETEDQWTWVSDMLKGNLLLLPAPIVGYTSLAVGVDQLFAQMVVAVGGDLRAVIPFRGYERTLQGSGLAHYKKLLKQAGVEVLPDADSDEDAFLAAGKRIVESVEVMFAVWDGAPSRGKGGTADIVAYSSQMEIPVIHFNPLSRSVTKIHL